MLDPVTAFLLFGAVLGTVTVDVGMNTMQNYYDTFYADAFWEHAGQNAEVERRLADEERQIDLMFQKSDFTSRK
ncbi:hypothetical protein ABLE91_16685 [Aquabacter sp. CN5-332]|uniref:hypothetical protein n=1 Tax=Aquabacter sp. CN5-332 TaxID=3156608 RepID=UPI0032B4258D